MQLICGKYIYLSARSYLSAKVQWHGISPIDVQTTCDKMKAISFFFYCGLKMEVRRAGDQFVYCNQMFESRYCVCLVCVCVCVIQKWQTNALVKPWKKAIFMEKKAYACVYMIWSCLLNCICYSLWIVEFCSLNVLVRHEFTFNVILSISIYIYDQIHYFCSEYV